MRYWFYRCDDTGPKPTREKPLKERPHRDLVNLDANRINEMKAERVREAEERKSVYTNTHRSTHHHRLLIQPCASCPDGLVSLDSRHARVRCSAGCDYRLHAACLRRLGVAPQTACVRCTGAVTRVEFWANSAVERTEIVHEEGQDERKEPDRITAEAGEEPHQDAEDGPEGIEEPQQNDPEDGPEETEGPVTGQKVDTREVKLNRPVVALTPKRVDSVVMRKGRHRTRKRKETSMSLPDFHSLGQDDDIKFPRNILLSSFENQSVHFP
jgi:hypothetical protein